MSTVPIMRRREAAIEAVVGAWITPGPRPDIHDAAKSRLRREWPTLARALDRLAEADIALARITDPAPRTTTRGDLT